MRFHFGRAPFATKAPLAPSARAESIGIVRPPAKLKPRHLSPGPRNGPPKGKVFKFAFHFKTRHRRRAHSKAAVSRGLYQGVSQPKGKAKVDLLEMPARLSGLCFWWTCLTCLIPRLRHRKARQWKRGQPRRRPSCRQIARAGVSPRQYRPGAPRGSTYCARAPCLARVRRGRAR